MATIKHNEEVKQVVQPETFDILGLTKQQLAVIHGLLGRRRGIDGKQYGDTYDLYQILEKELSKIKFHHQVNVMLEPPSIIVTER